jgi:hypothetical protein
MFSLLLATFLAGPPASLDNLHVAAERARDKKVMNLLSEDMRDLQATLRSDERALGAAYGLLRYDIRNAELVEAADDVTRVGELEWNIVSDLANIKADRRLEQEDRADLRSEKHATTVVTPAALMVGG